MANYRQIHVKIWKDDFFGELSPEHKLLFIYLFSNELASVSGIYKLPLRVVIFETGLDKEIVVNGLAFFEQQGKVMYRDGVVWVKNLMRYNATNSASEKIQPRIKADVEDIPDSSPVKQAYLQDAIPYPQPQIPYQGPQIPSPALPPDHHHHQEQDHHQEQEQEQDHHHQDAPENENGDEDDDPSGSDSESEEIPEEQTEGQEDEDDLLAYACAKWREKGQDDQQDAPTLLELSQKYPNRSVWEDAFLLFGAHKGRTLAYLMKCLATASETPPKRGSPPAAQKDGRRYCEGKYAAYFKPRSLPPVEAT